MSRINFVRHFSRKVCLGNCRGDRLNRAMTHLLLLPLDGKILWHFRGIFREVFRNGLKRG